MGVAAADDVIYRMFEQGQRGKGPRSQDHSTIHVNTVESGSEETFAHKNLWSYIVRNV